MREILNVRQHTDESRRRWFVDDYFELIVWFDAADRIVLFELSYDLEHDWRAIRWNAADGCTHFRVDDGEDRPHRNATPLLRKATDPPPEAMWDAFERQSGSLDEAVLPVVAVRLREYRSALVKG